MKGINDGIENEIHITRSINNKKLKVLSEYHRKFIEQLNPNVTENTIIRAEKIGGQGFKPDIRIEIERKKWNISVKKGGGNSVHQEKIEYFIHYCMHFLGMTETEKESLLLFLYGDGTNDGNSDAAERISDDELMETFKDEIKIVQRFLNRNKRNLIERFLIYGKLGKYKNIKAEYLYHGDAHNGIWCPLDDKAVDYLANLPNSSTAPLSIGPLTIQVWNRNLNADPKLEDRRHSIQVKWGSCTSHIKEINRIHLESPLIHVEEENKVLGDNSQGFNNQEKLMWLLDYQRVGNLSPTLKSIIKEIYPYAASSDVVRAKKIGGIDIKPRIAININNEVKNLSVFMGTGNAVHQEGIHTFIPFCKEELGMNSEQEVAMLELIYGDGTIDGKSIPENRLNDLQLKTEYASQINMVQRFIDDNKKELIERFLVYGKGGKIKNIKSDYIYYGTDVTGRIAPYPDVVEYLVSQENSKSALLAIGSLTIQTWNRNMGGKQENEYKRNSIQVKWGSMKKHLNCIREKLEKNQKGTTDGNWEEYELVYKLNKNKNLESKIWNKISKKLNLTNLDDVFAIRVCNTVYSHLAERNVLPKADIYLIKGKINQSILIDNNYWLDEDVIQNLDYEIIKYSGISCKRPDSKSFTYSKLSINSFNRLFNDNDFGAGISMFVKVDEVNLNYDIARAWGTDEKKLLTKFTPYLNEAGVSLEVRSLNNIDVCKIIKNISTKQVEKIIKENNNVGNAIFKGIGIFEEPYTANFTYINGQIESTFTPRFSITTGSGRHKGNYTIVIK